MEWVNSIQNAIDFIESHITEDIKIQDVADAVYMSTFYFQKGFSMLCGYSVAEYIRNRRLALAGSELANCDVKVIDVALKYGYESSDSFTKAFTRFHGVSPNVVRKQNVMIKSFTPLRLNISWSGGNIMNYKIEKKKSFKVLGVSKRFSYDTCKEEIPLFWNEHYAKVNGQYVCGMFGINVDEKMGGEDFEYLIADLYDSSKVIPDGFTVKEIPEFTWAIFSCDGPMPMALQDVNKKIFSEWLPALKDYEFAAGYCIELYDDASKYPKGTLDKNYHSEIWIPIKGK